MSLTLDAPAAASSRSVRRTAQASSARTTTLPMTLPSMSTSPNQAGSRSCRIHSTPQKGIVQRNQPMTTAPARSRRRSRPAATPRIAGTMTMIQCRWCTQLTGESRKPARPIAATSASQSPWRQARWATQKTAAPASSSHGAQARVSSVPSRPRRSSSPRKAWLAEPSFGPSRVGSDSAPPQKVNDAGGSTIQAPTETKTAVPIAVKASRQRRHSR